MLLDLIKHKGHANASMLKAIREHDVAAQDPELRKLLHHILLANRFWLMLILGLPFVLDEESRIPETLEALTNKYCETHAQEIEWLSHAQETDLERRLETSYSPGQSYSIAEALMQVCLHSHGHRAQCAARLRLLGGTPPTTDFIVWLHDRSAPEW